MNRPPVDPAAIFAPFAGLKPKNRRKTAWIEVCSIPRMLVQLPTDDLTELIIGKGMVVHDYFGPGLFETVYTRCLGLLLVEAGLIVEIEKPLPVRFKSLSIDCGYRLDLLIENTVVVEVKAVRSRRYTRHKCSRISG